MLHLTSRAILVCLFITAPLLAQPRPPQREVALTFDDLPSTHGDLATFKEVTTKILATLEANHAPAIGFVNEFKLHPGGRLDGQRVAVLRQWLEAGHELGNHTWSHVAIDRASLDVYKSEVIRGETQTKKLLQARGKKLRYFRHTQLRTGPTVAYKKGLEKFLASRGYTIAPVTIDNNDYIFAGVYSRAKQRGDRATMKRVADAYIPYMEQIFSFFEKLSRDSLGYEVKQTLLLHANELNADYLDELIAMMRRRGYRFVTLEQALKDPAYVKRDAQVAKGLSWLHRWMLAEGKTLKPEPLEPAFVRELFQKL